MQIAETKLKEENELLLHYNTKIKGMVKDGVVSWEDYLQTDMKILFVLKEVNGGEDWDLREFLRKGGRPSTWNNVTRWIKGINNINYEYEWKDIENIQTEDRISLLKNIAAINVKKTSGGSVADSNAVYEAAKNNKELLKAQVKLYNPNLIICCGTANEYFDFVCDNKKVEWKSTKKGIWYVVENECVIVNYNHPEARVGANLLYYGLIDAVREIYNDK